MSKFILTCGNPARFYLFFTLIAYVFIYSLFLYLSDFLPYVFDNNETYSSLVHANNMYFGDWGVHFGLADDAYSPDPAAHPTIHTHQGNWPRIFAYILFSLGARSAESQIAIHVFTIGLFSIWFMYRFFSKNTNYKFAAIACLIFMTDYILFAQWQVVTYRIWHVFFVFASLNCVQEINGTNRLWKLLFFFNFATLYYGELVFAFYISIWSLLYYAYLVSWNLKHIFKVGLLIAASGSVSLLILFSQLCMYMGIDNVILDFSYTFMARNFSGDAIETQQHMQDFYNNMSIAFWNNIVDGSKLKTIDQFITNIFSYGFQMHTPVLSLQALFVFVSIMLCSIRTSLEKIYTKLFDYRLPSSVAISVTFISMYLFISTLFFDNKFLGLYEHHEFYAHGPILLMFLLPAFSWFLTNAIFKISNPFGNKVSCINIIFINICILIYAWLVGALPSYYLQSSSIIWFKYLTGNISITLWRLLSIFVVFSCVLNIALNRDFVRNIFKNKTVFAFIITSVLAYAIVYVLSPGYIFSGYLVRSAPFIVFFIDCVIAIFFWYMLESTILQLRLSNIYSTIGKKNTLNISTALIKITAICMFSTVCYQWLYIQYAYFKLFPPTSIGFIKKLRQQEFRGKSVITNQYAVPFSYETRNWAYNGINYGAGTLSFTDQGFLLPHNIEYMWYKNKNDFAGYKQPDYYVCFAPNTYDSAVNELKMLTNNARRCSTNRVVSQAMLIKTKLSTSSDLRLHHTLLSSDPSKQDGWAIVKMDWEFPPYFETHANGKQHFLVIYDKANKLLKINYEFKQQNGIPEEISRFKIVQYFKNKKVVLSEFSGKNGKASIKLIDNTYGKLEIIGIPYTANKQGHMISEMVDIARD